MARCSKRLLTPLAASVTHSFKESSSCCTKWHFGTSWHTILWWQWALRKYRAYPRNFGWGRQVSRLFDRVSFARGSASFTSSADLPEWLQYILNPPVGSIVNNYVGNFKATSLHSSPFRPRAESPAIIYGKILLGRVAKISLHQDIVLLAIEGCCWWSNWWWKWTCMISGAQYLLLAFKYVIP